LQNCKTFRLKLYANSGQLFYKFIFYLGFINFCRKEQFEECKNLLDFFLRIESKLRGSRNGGQRKENLEEKA